MRKVCMTRTEFLKRADLPVEPALISVEVVGDTVVINFDGGDELCEIGGEMVTREICEPSVIIEWKPSLVAKKDIAQWTITLPAISNATGS